jgi:hypothetical protein
MTTSFLDSVLTADPDITADDDTQPGTGPGHALVKLGGGRMNAAEQILVIARHALRVARRRARDLADREGGWINGLLAGKPPSVREQAEYLEQRKWLPPGHEGGVADRAGAIYHRFIGLPGVAAGNAISATCARPFRFLWAAVIITGAVVLVLELI